MRNFFTDSQADVIIKHAKSVCKHADALASSKTRFVEQLEPVLVDAFEGAGLPAWGEDEWDLVDSIPTKRRNTIQAVKDEAMAIYANADEKARDAIQVVLNLRSDVEITGDHWAAYRTETKGKYRAGLKTVENVLSTLCGKCGYAMKKPAAKKEKWEQLLDFMQQKEFDGVEVVAAVAAFCRLNEVTLPAELCQFMDAESVVKYGEMLVDSDALATA